MIYVVLCPGAPEGATVVLVLKHPRGWGHSLKSLSTDWESRGIELWSDLSTLPRGLTVSVNLMC